MDRECTIQLAYSGDREILFALGFVEPGTPLLLADSGDYHFTGLIAGANLFFGLDAIDINSNRLLLGSLLIDDGISTISYSSNSNLGSYLTDGDYNSSGASYSSDGSKVVFSTSADNFSGTHINTSATQIAEWDRNTGIITYLTDGDNYSYSPQYNSDGSKVVFYTDCNTFSGTHSYPDSTQIAEWERGSGTVTYLTDGEYGCYYPDYSYDDSRVVFETDSNNFSGSHSFPDTVQIEEWERGTGIVTFLTDGDSDSFKPQYNSDASKIVFYTHADNFIGVHTQTVVEQIAELDRSTGTITYLTDGDDESLDPEYSNDDSKILFPTAADSFIGVHTNSDYRQVAEWDRITGFVVYLTDADNHTYAPQYCHDKNEIIFSTDADIYSGAHINANRIQVVEWVRP